MTGGDRRRKADAAFGRDTPRTDAEKVHERSQALIAAIAHAADMTTTLAAFGVHLPSHHFKSERYAALRELLSQANVAKEAKARDIEARAWQEAYRLERQEPGIKRKAIASRVAPIIGRSFDHTMKLLAKMKMPETSGARGRTRR